jgi:hypothetical protein
LQVTPGKENIADPFLSADHRFLTPVDPNGGDMVCRITPAISRFSGIPVNPTGPWTKNTMIKLLHHSANLGHSRRGKRGDVPLIKNNLAE